MILCKISIHLCLDCYMLWHCIKRIICLSKRVQYFLYLSSTLIIEFGECDEQVANWPNLKHLNRDIFGERTDKRWMWYREIIMTSLFQMETCAIVLEYCRNWVITSGSTAIVLTSAIKCTHNFKSIIYSNISHQHYTLWKTTLNQQYFNWWTSENRIHVACTILHLCIRY